jgi:general secretion pathway protein K
MMQGGDAREHGFALVAVLWAAIILAIVVASVQQMIWADAQLVRGSQATAQLHETADAAVNLVILRLLGPPVTQPPLDGTPFQVPFGGLNVRTSVQDEAGKIDLNMASEAVLRSLLSFVGLDAEDAEVMTDRILDWREKTQTHRLNGAKAQEYQAAGLLYAPRDGPFRSVNEIQMVLGMTPELYRRMAPLLTVYSQSAWVDPTFAPIGVLRLLAAFDPSAMDALRRRENDWSDATTSAPRQLVAIGHVFTINVELTGPGAVRVNRTAIIRLTGQASAPIWVYQWN